MGTGSTEEVDQSTALNRKISIVGLQVEYPTETGSITAIDDATFDIMENEFVCILGPSGRGKSTLLFVLAGLVSPSGGKVLMDGVPIEGAGRERAVIFQEDATFPWFTVRSNVEYGLRVQGVSPSKRRAITDHYLEVVGLEDVADLYPKELSGGMKKRVDIARAFANDPEVLLMDEPFGMLDVMTKSALQREVARMYLEEKKTIVFVTHDLEEALFLSDRMVLMTARPSRIARVMENPLPMPRDEMMKTSSEFQKLRRELMQFFTSEGSEERRFRTV